MHNNFIVLGGYKLLGYCTWKEELKKTKHINYMQNLSPILKSEIFKHFQQKFFFSRAFQAPLKS